MQFKTGDRVKLIPPMADKITWAKGQAGTVTAIKIITPSYMSPYQRIMVEYPDGGWTEGPGRHYTPYQEGEA